MAAANDASTYLRVDALQRLRPDTSQATLALMLRLASREEADLVTLAAASHLAFLRTPNAGRALAQFLADTMVPVSNRQVALSHLRLDGANRLESGVLRALLPRLAGGSAQSTLLELVTLKGNSGDREWVWSVVLDEAVSPLTRLTGLQQVGGGRRASELGALFERANARLVRYGVVEVLRDHSDPNATATLRRLRNGVAAGAMRDAIEAAITVRLGR